MKDLLNWRQLSLFDDADSGLLGPLVGSGTVMVRSSEFMLVGHTQLQAFDRDSADAFSCNWEPVRVS